jgi:DNA-directed RNA polymerase subunit RPC12/RpoP
MEEQFQLIGTFQYSAEAQILKGKLEYENIMVFMRDNHTIDSNPLYSQAIGGVKLFVKKIDFEKAQEIVNSINNYSLDDDLKPIVCPKCGEQKAEMYTTIKDFKSLFSYIFSALFTICLPFYSKYKYKCTICKTEF